MPQHHFDILNQVTSVNIYRTKLEPGSLLYVPAGFLVFERVLGSDLVLGSRCSTIDRVGSGSFLALVKAYGAGLPDKKLFDFWLAVARQLDQQEAASIAQTVQISAEGKEEGTPAEGATDSAPSSADAALEEADPAASAGVAAVAVQNLAEPVA